MYHLPSNVVSIDIETGGLDARTNPDTPIWCVGFYSTLLQVSLRWETGEAQTQLRELLADPSVYFVLHNSTFDRPSLSIRGIDIPWNRIHDTMCMSYVIHPESLYNHSLQTLAPKVGERKIEYKDWEGGWTELMAQRNLSDCKITWLLYQYFKRLFAHEQDALAYYFDIEMPYCEIIEQLESNGVRINREELLKTKVFTEEQIEKYLSILQKEVGVTKKTPVLYQTKTLLGVKKTVTTATGRTRTTHEQVGVYKLRQPHPGSTFTCQYDHYDIEWFNPNSSDQVAQALIDKYGWRPSKVSKKTGKPCTDKSVLEALDYPLCKVLREHSKYSHNYTSFVTPILERIDQNDILRGEFRHFQTRTRRLSSANPNLQNIPARGEIGAGMRKMFISRPGHKLVVGDLDRIEVVVLAFYLEMLFGNTTMSDALRANIDVHQVNADDWGLSKRYGSDGRKKAKNGLFCFCYGGGTGKFSDTIGVDRKTGAEILELMQERNPALFDIRNYVVKLAEKNGGVLHDWFGGRIVVPEVLSDDRETYAAGCRQIFNYLIQGTAGSVFKYLQLKSLYHLKEHNPALLDHLKLLLVVHDEAIYEVPDEYADETAYVLTQLYTDNSILVDDETDTQLTVRAEFKFADNWYDAKGE